MVDQIEGRGKAATQEALASNLFHCSCDAVPGGRFSLGHWSTVMLGFCTARPRPRHMQCHRSPDHHPGTMPTRRMPTRTTFGCSTNCVARLPQCRGLLRRVRGRVTNRRGSAKQRRGSHELRAQLPAVADPGRSSAAYQEWSCCA